MDKPFVAVPCDETVVQQWAAKLAPLCEQTEETCRIWLAAFLTAVRLERCQHMPEEVRDCRHLSSMVGIEEKCPECLRVMATRLGHTEAGVYWTAGEVMDIASRAPTNRA